MTLKIIAISDSHSRHEKLQINPCDILVHTGDFSRFGGRDEFKKFINWFAVQPAENKIFICGNHDIIGENHKELVEKTSKDLGIIYLCDSGVTVRGINFWGSPVVPKWGPWAFMKDRNSPELKKHVSMIPDNTDVLLCHGPPFGYGDFNGKTHVGCELLLERIKQVRPKIVACGHIHESYGAYYTDFGTIVVNSAQLNFIHLNINKPFELIWEAEHD